MKNKLLEAVSDTVAEKGIRITIPIYAKSKWHALKQQLGFSAKEHTFLVRPVTFGCLIKMSKLLLSLDLEEFTTKAFLRSSYEIINKNGRAVAEVIATFINGSRSDPPERLINMILDNFSSEEMLKTAIVLLNQMNLSDFMNSIISISGTNVMETKAVNVKTAEENEVSL